MSIPPKAGDSVTITGGSITFPSGENHLGEVGGKTGVASTDIVRGADVTAYSPNDAVLNAAGILCEVTNMARTNGGSGYIVGLRVVTNKKSITPRLRVHFFNSSSATISADNLPWQEKFVDSNYRLGYYDMPAMTTAADAVNSDISRTIDFSVRIPFLCAPATRSIWLALETLDAFTPDASQAFRVYLSTELN